jgi:hypothetical protein
MSLHCLLLLTTTHNSQLTTEERRQQDEATSRRHFLQGGRADQTIEEHCPIQIVLNVLN